YSLGIVLYVISTGKSHRDFPEPPADLASRPDRERWLELQAIIHRACQADPRERYASAQAMRADLESLQNGRSVKRQHLIKRRLAACKKAALSLATLMAVTAILAVAWRMLNRSTFSGDGPPSTNQLANALCAKAMLVLRGDNRAAFGEAYTNLHRAIALDANFARPYVGLFELRSREGVASLGPASLGEMHTIAQRLHVLAPDLGATHCAQSLVHFYEWDFPEALARARQSVKANSDYEFGHLWYGYILTHWGWTNEALRETEIALDLAPSKAAVYRSLGHCYYLRRDFTNAITMYRQALEWEPQHTAAIYWIGRACQALGDYLAAVSYFEKTEFPSGTDEAGAKTTGDAFRTAFKEGGERGYWQEAWKRAERKGDREFYLKATIQCRLGKTNAAFGWLSRSYESRETSGGWFERPLNYLLFDECWDNMRDDPRFEELIEKIGFTKVMPRPARP
ncbi:MAG: tetratricopeptide repeat-containing serine/threonine-protein kinase, partial [Verrucomicrobiales bacterium]|nr:tetratricopeptide repeat-containing serine/threonine-protein kinase [Verrucomicrobiales bacterium]